MRPWHEETCWQLLSAAVARLKLKVERAYYHGDEATADTAHDDLVSAEWRLRQAETRMGGRTGLPDHQSHEAKK